MSYSKDQTELVSVREKVLKFYPQAFCTEQRFASCYRYTVQHFDDALVGHSYLASTELGAKTC